MQRRTMTRISLLAAGLAVGLVFAAPAAPTGAMAPKKLTGRDRPWLHDHAQEGHGTAVRTLRAGKYTITVQDKSNIHNFRLRGPG